MVNLDDFRYGGTNITAFRLLDPERDEVKQVVQDWIFGEMRYGRKMEAHEQTIKVIKQYPSINKQTNIIYKVFCLSNEMIVVLYTLTYYLISVTL